MIYQDVNNNNGNNNGNGVVQQPVQSQPQKVAIGEPAPMVQQAAQQSFAMKNFFSGGNKAVGRFENPNVVNPPLANAGESIPEEPENPATVTDAPSHAPSWEEMDGMAQNNVNNSNDNGNRLSLSDVLNGGSGASRDDKSQFVADPEKKDGGFFKWIKGLLPKNRPGMREGETEDEYDRRRTRNMQMVATLADAIRHIGNIVNTSKGATQQKFNSPVELLEQGYQQRKAERQKQAALDADAAYKLADLSLKEKAAEANRSYKDFARQMNVAKFGYQQAKDAAEQKRRAERDAENKDYKERVFEHRKEQDKISNSLRQQSINKRGSGGGGKKGGSSSHKYVTWDADGNPHYAENKTMYEANEAYYNGNVNGKTSRSTSKENVTSKGLERVTNRTSGPSVAQQAGAQRRKREEARRAAKAGAKPKGKSGGKKGWASGFKL